MRRTTLLAVASLALAACGMGCQNSGEAEASVDADRPEMTASASTDSPTVTAQTSTETRTYTAPEARPAGAEISTTPADASAYTVPYKTASDAPYMRTSTDTATAGTLKSGDTVYLRSDAPAAGIVPAKTADGRIVYVRASDLRKQ